jgi:hypothetical protein
LENKSLGEITNLPNGVKPIAMNSQMIIYTYQGQVGLMSPKGLKLCEPIPIDFKPKHLVSLDCSKTE